MTTTHEKIMVHGPLNFSHILGLSLHVQGNQHGCMTVRGYLDPISAQRDSQRDLEGCFFCLQALRSMDSEAPSPVFWGTADNFHVHQVGDVFIADIRIITPTAMLDVIPRSRSFQDISMTYKQVVEDILNDTPNASAAFAEIANQPIGKPLIQYKETDWEFIKRLASMLNTQLIPDCTTPFPYFSFGQVPQMAETLSADEYMVISDSRFYEMGSSEVGLYKPDFLCYSVPSTQFYRIGTQTVFGGQTMSVCELDAVLQDGELLYTYKISRAGWFSQREIPNRKLIGLCLPGTVVWTKREVLHIDLDIDAGRDPGYYPFSWIPESGNIMYCMPKLGTRAMLYLPSFDTGEAIAITSPRTNGDTCGAMSDPQLRCLTTEHGKRMCLFPKNVIFSGGNPGEVLHVEFDDLSSMLLESTRAIQIIAQLQIEIEAPRVTLSTPQEIQACRAPARARAKVSMIVPKGTGGGNPPTGGKNTFLTMQYQFDLLGEKGILCGTDFKTYDPILDEPDTKSFTLGSLLLGLAIGVAVAAVVVVSVATFGVAATALGAMAIAAALILSGCTGQVETPSASPAITDAGADESKDISPSTEPIIEDDQLSDDDEQENLGSEAELLVTMDQLSAFGWFDVTNDDVTELNRVLIKYEINTPVRIAFFLGQCKLESQDFSRTLEKYNTKPEDGIYTAEDYFNQQYSDRDSLGNKGGNDGELFRGAGYTHLTGRYNYQQFADYIGIPEIMTEGYRLIGGTYNKPVEEIERGERGVIDVAELAWEASAYFYCMNNPSKENLNTFADQLDATSVSKAINSGGGADSRKRRADNIREFYKIYTGEDIGTLK